VWDQDHGDPPPIAYHQQKENSITGISRQQPDTLSNWKLNWNQDYPRWWIFGRNGLMILTGFVKRSQQRWR